MAKHLSIATMLALLAAIGSAHGQASEAYRTLIVDGIEREWQILVPASYRDDQPAPLVLEFHGTGGTPESQVELSGFPALAEEQGFLLVTPVAKYPRAADGRLTWNVDLLEDAVDDVAFIDQLLDVIAEEYAVDPARIFATGFSGGARMSSRLACNLAERVAAIGPVGGVRYPEDCSPARPVPVIAFHGKQDAINHYALRDDSPDYWLMGVEDAIAGWARNNGCATPPGSRPSTTDETRVAWAGCRNGADVVFYLSETANHTWPGSPIADRFVDWLGEDAVSATPATALIWQFFQEHPMP